MCIFYRVPDGEQGMEQVKNNEVDFILLDVLMPKVHGVQMLEQLKMEKEYQDIPVVFLTNYPDDPRVKKACDAGQCEVISKLEVKLNDVIKKIKEKLN